MKRLCLLTLTAALSASVAIAQTPPTKPSGTPPVASPNPGDSTTKVPTPGDPKDPPKTPPNPLLEEARKLFSENKPTECFAKLKEATDKDNNLQPPAIIFTSYLVEAQKGSDARRLLEQFIAQNPDHPDGYLQNANFAYNEGRITDALQSCYLAKQLATLPKWNSAQSQRFELAARTGLIACLELRGDYQAMSEHVQWMVNKDPNVAALRLRLAQVKFNVGQPETAMAELVAAHKIDPSIDPPELRMGAFWAAKPVVQTDTTPAAVAAAEKEAAENRAKALDLIKKAISVYPSSPKPLRGYANFLLEERNFGEADKAIADAEKMDDKARETKSLKALCLRYKAQDAKGNKASDGKADYDKAIAIFASLYTDDPRDAFSLGNLAICYMEIGDKAKATNYADTLVNANPKSGEAYAVRGWVRYRFATDEKDAAAKAKAMEEAEKDFNAARSSGQAMLDTAYYLASFDESKNKKTEALELIKGACAKKGAFVYKADAQKLLTKLDIPENQPKEKPKTP